MSKHTPGPWRLYDDGARYPLVQRGESGGFKLIDKDIERCRSDARLIASAPDLLEALENLLAVVEGDGGTKENAHEIARAAIAKATGEG